MKLTEVAHGADRRQAQKLMEEAVNELGSHTGIEEWPGQEENR